MLKILRYLILEIRRIEGSQYLVLELGKHNFVIAFCYLLPVDANVVVVGEPVRRKVKPFLF